MYNKVAPNVGRNSVMEFGAGRNLENKLAVAPDETMCSVWKLASSDLESDIGVVRWPSIAPAQISKDGAS